MDGDREENSSLHVHHEELLSYLNEEEESPFLSKILLNFRDVRMEQMYNDPKRNSLPKLILSALLCTWILNSSFWYFQKQQLADLFALASGSVALLLLLFSFKCKCTRFLHHCVYCTVILRATVSPILGSGENLAPDSIFDLAQVLIYAPLLFGCFLDINPIVLACFQAAMLGMFFSVLHTSHFKLTGSWQQSQRIETLCIGFVCFFFGYLLLRHRRLAFIRTMRFNNLKRVLSQLEQDRQKDILELKTTLELKGRYIAQVAHDLGTPITIFSLAIELLQDFLKENLRSLEVENIMETCQCAVELMTVTREEVISQGKHLHGLEMRPQIVQVKLHDILLRGLQLTRFIWQNQLHFEFYLDLKLQGQVFTDCSWIWSMLVNFLSNAKKYSNGGCVVTTIFATGCKDTFRVEVSDEGIGVPPSAKDQLFKPYSQLMGGAGGTGLGLHGVFLKATTLNGTVDMRDNPSSPSGSIFAFEVPLVQGEYEVNVDTPRKKKAAALGSVLFIGKWTQQLKQESMDYLKERFYGVDEVEDTTLFMKSSQLSTTHYSLVFWMLENTVVPTPTHRLEDLVAFMLKHWTGQSPDGYAPAIYISDMQAQNYPVPKSPVSPSPDPLLWYSSETSQTKGCCAKKMSWFSSNKPTQVYHAAMHDAAKSPSSRYLKSINLDSSVSRNRQFSFQSSEEFSSHRKITSLHTTSDIAAVFPDVDLPDNAKGIDLMNFQEKILRCFQGRATFLHRPVTVWDIKSFAAQTKDSKIESKKQSSSKVAPTNALPLASLSLACTSEDATGAVFENSILLVDDDASILKFTSKMLEKNGFQVTAKMNGMEGLNALQLKEFAVAIIDMNMPVMDGLECIRRFREWETEALQKKQRQASQFIFILSANAPSNSEATNSGANEFVSKPVKIKDLVEKINKAKETFIHS